MTHHIVGYRTLIPRTVVRTILESEDTDLLGRIWCPDMERGHQDEVKPYILAGWTIHWEAVE